MPASDATAGLSPPPDPPQDQAAKPPPQNIANFLLILRVLLDYGRHLTLTLEQRATERSFSTLAQFFGTARLDAILARVTRGMLRIAALEQVLRERAARGRDVLLRRVGERSRRKPPAPQPDQPDAGTNDSQPERKPPRRRPAPDPAADLDHLPTLEQLVAHIRRRPIGCTIADICRDLGVRPMLCQSWMWTELFDAITWTRGSVPGLMRDFRRREKAFQPEWDHDPNLAIPEQTQDAIRRVLGFLLGDKPTAPFWVATPGLDEAAAKPP